MSGYLLIEAVRPQFASGPPPMPVVDRRLVEARIPRKPRKPRKPRDAEKQPAQPAQPVQPAQPYRLPGITTHQRDHMRALRKQGVTLKAIAARFGRSEKLVWTYTRNIPPPEGGWPGKVKKKIDKAEAVALRAQGLTYKAIAAHFGATHGNAYKAIHGYRPYSEPGQKPEPIRTKGLARTVAAVTGIPASLMRSPRAALGRPSNVDLAKARHILFWLVRRAYPNASLSRIGRRLGDYHHTSLLYGLARVERVIEARGLDRSAPTSALTRALWSADWPPRNGKRPS